MLPIIITAHATIDTAVEGTKQGAYSYIPKPFTPDELLLAIKNGLERRALTMEARRLREERERRLLEVAAERSQEQHDHPVHDRRHPGHQQREAGRAAQRHAATRILPGTQAVPFPLASLACAEVHGSDRRGAGRGRRPHDPVPRKWPWASPPTW